MTNHKHLRTVIEDIYSNDNKLTENLLSKLINEFRYSNLLIPAKSENGTLNFIIYEEEGSKFTPLFTDPDEFHKFFRDDDIIFLENSFELYQNVLKTSDIEGYILNPASEKYLFSKEFILSIKNIPKTNFYSPDAYSKEELLEIKNSIDNRDLEDFIADKNNIGDYEGLFEKLSSSTILTLMLADSNLDPMAENGMISLKDYGPLAQMYTDRIGGVYATIFSSEDKLKHVKTDKFKYSQIINLATLVNFVLTEDMDGIVLNPESDNVLIPRSKLLKYSLGFERFANDEKLSTSIFYIFC
ncbi:SseB family protein [Methanobrevibacter sp.]|uniref:SseB family protein n=1 Tax=Methanobrevibacter sp. TaxID=66852 RepID=UPI00388E4EC7